MNKVVCSTISSCNTPPQSADHASFSPKLAENEIVEGKVLKSFSLNNVLLLIKGKRMLGRTHIPLREGSVISLKVEEGYPNPIFKLLGGINENVETINTSMILNGLKKNLWKLMAENIEHRSLPDNVKNRFKTLINDISKDLYLKANSDLLKDLVDKSGISWEAKLREIVTSNSNYGKENIHDLLNGDLKGLGSKIISLMEGKSELFERFVSTIKNIQLLNQLGVEQERKIFIPVPFQLPDGFFTLGQLLIHFNRQKDQDSDRKEKDKNFFRISFLLEMSNIGPLRADLAVRKKEITGRFLIVEDKTKLAIEKHLPSLMETLRTKGFSILHMECQVKKPNDIRDTLIKEIIHDDCYNINLVA